LFFNEYIKMNKKTRLDILLVNRNIYPTREKAKRAIMAGMVIIDGQIADKPGQSYSEEVEITTKGDTCPYVSRGGLKLEKAITIFNIDCNGRVAVDIGASTGGFTDCLLKHGIKRVYAVDVGYGQIAWEIRQNPAVIVIERTNARYLSSDHIPEKVHIITMDVSFISITKILPVARNFLLEDGKIITLIKPQFEAGKNQVGKGGVVKKKEVHLDVLNNIFSFCNDSGIYVTALDFSPVLGPAGNMEFLASIELTPGDVKIDPEKCVTEGHVYFQKME